MNNVVLILVLVLSPILAVAKEAVPLEADPIVARRIQSLSDELRCLKCQNQSIADSRSGFANQIRDELRDQIKEGRSDDQIKTYLTDRYGDFIVYDPPFNLVNSIVWLAPVFILVVGISVLMINIRRQSKSQPSAELDDQQNQKLQKILAESEAAKGKTI